MRVEAVKENLAYEKALNELNYFLGGLKGEGRPSQKVLVQFNRLQTNLELAKAFGGV